MHRTSKERNSPRPAPRYRDIEGGDQDLNEISAEPRARLRRHELVDFSDLFLDHDAELKQERDQDW
jgi:hypothetical protein